MTSLSAPTAHPSMVLAAWVEPLVRGRRVAVFGEASAGLAERLADRGARQVHAWDRDSARVAEAVARSGGARGPVIHALHAGDLGVRAGAFDVVVVGDLSLFSAPDEIVAQARRLLGPSGVCVIASPNPEASRQLVPTGQRSASEPPPLGYYDLYDVVCADFSQVRMAGQAPFVGYTVADFAPDGEPEVSVDTSLLETSEEPEWFVAVASERAVTLDAFAVIEVPFSDLYEPATPSDPVTRRGDASRRAAPAAIQPDPRIKLLEAAHLAGEAEAARARARARCASPRSPLAWPSWRPSSPTARRAGGAAGRARRARGACARAGGRALRPRHACASWTPSSPVATRACASWRPPWPAAGQATGDARVRADRLALEVQELELELGRQRERADALESVHTNTARSASVAAASAEGRLAELTREADQDRSTITLLTAQRDDIAARVHELELALDETDRARLELGQRLAAAEARHAQALDDRERAAGESSHADLTAMEERLRERGQAVAALQRQLAEAERIGRELVADLEDLRLASNGAAVRPPPAQRLPALVAPAASPGEGEAGLRERLDLLGRRAAESEANYVAASWRVTELEQRLADAQRGGEVDSVDAEIEQALVAAHSEIAALRRLVGEPAPQGALAADEGGAARASTEDAVLLHQVAGELAGRS
ncbi:MAG: methyltransferase domain-containing protein [Polyangiaceae bacterium]